MTPDEEDLLFFDPENLGDSAVESWDVVLEVLIDPEEYGCKIFGINTRLGFSTVTELRRA